MAISNIDLFRQFEENIDKLISSFGVRQMPVRVPHTNLYGIVSAAYAKDTKTGVPNRPEAGAAVVSRMSYLLNILSACPLVPGGDSAFDAVQALDATGHQEMMLLLNYAHFCEIAPFVWKGYFEIGGDEQTLTLRHPNKLIQDSETRDIILNSLVLPFSISHPEDCKEYFDRQVDSLPVVDASGMIAIMAKFTDWFAQFSLECSPLSDDAMLAAIGINEKQFQKCRAVWLSIAEFHVQMADAIRRRLERDPTSEDRIGAEYFEWTAPLLSEKFLENCMRQVSGINEKQYAALMNIYSFDPADPRNGGEGFLPPFCRTSIGLLFSPYAVQHMLSSRNILYATLKSNQKQFDEVISPYLEPHLVAVSRDIFIQLHDVEIALNHDWGLGECDMLVFRASENCVLHVQAKAALAPEGARMTARVEARVKEALGQLDRFAQLPQTRQDEILSNAFGKVVKDARVIDVVLCWSSFGSHSIWAELERVAPINIGLLANLIERDKNLPLSRFAELTHELIDEIVAAVDPTWEEGNLDFGKRNITISNLVFNSRELVRYQLAVHRQLITNH